MQAIEPYRAHPNYRRARQLILNKALKKAVVQDGRYAWQLFRSVPLRAWDRVTLKRFWRFLRYLHLSAGTLSGMRRPVHPVELLRAGQRLAIRGLEVQVVGVSHDAREPTQFVLSDGQRRFGMLTDLGVATAEVLECYRAVDALVVEANHDSTMLAGGPYPYFLKARVGGSRGHLNNHQSAELVKQLDWGRMQHLVLAHLSEKNNSPQLARQTFVDTLGCDPGWLQVADQHSGLDWREIA